MSGSMMATATATLLIQPPSGAPSRPGPHAALAWCAAMYLSGSCPDYTCAYSAAAAPSAAQIGAYHRELIGKQGADARPAYIMPPLNRQGTQPIGTPDVFCLCLLPAAAAQYLPAPLQALMDPSSPLADIFHSNLVWPPNLVARVREAVGSIAPGAYSSEELEAVRAGSVSVWAARGGKPDAVARGCALSPLAASPPSPFGGAKEQLHNPSYVMSGRMPPDESGSSMARWEWRVRQAADKSATPALAPSVSSLFALAGAQSHAPPSQQEPEMASLVAQSLSLNDSVSPPPPSSLPPPPAALLSKLAPARKASPALPGAAPAATSIPAICCAECGKGPNSSPRQGLYLNPLTATSTVKRAGRAITALIRPQALVTNAVDGERVSCERYNTDAHASASSRLPY